jgi:TetR/AcrR family transcriptional regulator, transcriptional repressor for nem operon
VVPREAKRLPTGVPELRFELLELFFQPHDGVPFWLIDAARASRGARNEVPRVALWYVRSKMADAVGDGKIPAAREVDDSMARPREFDEEAVLDAAMQCFWVHGYESTSVKDLIERTGLTAASLYNAYGDKRAMFLTALDHYIEKSVEVRLRRCEDLPPRDAIRSFFDEILRRSLGDRERKGCMIVNSALEIAPYDRECRETIVETLKRLESFFLDCVERGQADGTITSSQPAVGLAQHLLAVLMGVRVLARVRPERPLLEGVISTALTFLEGP